MKIASIVGARPQFIKYAALYNKMNGSNEEILIHTGQHYDHGMSKIFFQELNIPDPDYNLEVGSGDQGEQTGKMVIEIEKVLIKEKPDMVVVYGDTNSTLSGALAASKLQIKVAHIEAGLRSYDRTMPEEMNRVITDHISDLLFCPTHTAVNNLAKEGITNGVYLVGDIMIDALDYVKQIANEKSNILKKLDIEKRKYFVVTIHRAGNTDNARNMKNIIEALGELKMDVIFPIHPRTEKSLKNYGLSDKIPENVRLIEPLGYIDMVMLMDNAFKILTDSGGMQKEAYVLGVPCVTIRDNTEWVETLDGGWNVLVGANKNKISNTCNMFGHLEEQKYIFGKDVSQKITNYLCNETLNI